MKATGGSTLSGPFDDELSVWHLMWSSNAGEELVKVSVPSGRENELTTHEPSSKRKEFGVSFSLIPPPLWLESRLLAEYLQLRADPVFSRGSERRGGGHPVLLLSGLFLGDWSLDVLCEWLIRGGYRAETAGTPFNVVYSEGLLERLGARLARLKELANARVSLIGHSAGGIMAKVLSHRHPELVSEVVALGSPLAGVLGLHPFAVAEVQAARVISSFLHGSELQFESRLVEELAAPARVPLISIYSRSDGLLGWQSCLRADATCLEVQGSHYGLPFNVEVYQALGRVLSCEVPE